MPLTVSEEERDHRIRVRSRVSYDGVRTSGYGNCAREREDDAEGCLTR